MSGKDGGYLLPSVVDPQTISLCIEIPDDIYHIAAFWGALDTLTWSKNWQRDEAHTAAQVSRVWQRHIEAANDRFNEGIRCPDDFEEHCQSYPLTSPRIAWYPENPFNPNADVPSGYTYHPYTVVDSSILGTIIGLWGLGYRVGDVYTDFTKLPIGSFEPIITWEFFPRFEVLDLTGKGTVKLHLLNIPQGGRLFIVKDGVIDILNLQLVELNKDLGSFPQETQTALIVEIEFPENIAHTLQCAFLPTVDEALNPFFFGGGLREIELCGFGEVIMPTDGCCDETNNLLRAQLEMQKKIYLLWKGGLKLVPIGDGDPPDLVNFDTCAPEKYDQDATDDEPMAIERIAVLCYVTYCYVMVVLVKALTQMGLPLVTANILFPLYAASPTALQKVKVEYPEVLSIMALITGIPGGGALIDLVVCQMVAQLRGQFNTFEIFKNSLSVFGGVGTIAIPISGLVAATNQNRDNWLAFGEALAQGMDMDTEVALYTCPCDQDCTTPLELQIVNGRGTVVKVEAGDDLYHFTGDPGTFDGTNYHGGVNVRDAFGRCMTVWLALDGEPGVPTGFVDDGALYHDVVGCCGTSNSTGLLGGFAGTLEGDQMYTRFYWDRQDQPVDTYLHVKCFEC